MLFTKKIPVYFIVIAAVLGSILTLSTNLFGKKPPPEQAVQKEQVAQTGPVLKEGCELKIVRMSGFQFVKPLLFSDVECESEKLAPLKTAVQTEIEKEKTEGIITTASVYIRALNSGDWTVVNEKEAYSPGSLIKVATLMTILRKAEVTPGFITQEITVPADNTGIPIQTFNSKTVSPGKSYPIPELLEYLIAYSDNVATGALHNVITPAELMTTFTYLGLGSADLNNPNYKMTVQQYSLFMRALYNCSFLTQWDSDYAMSLLSKGDFAEGFKKGLPAGVQIAHKFGESLIGATKMLGESGIVYIEENPYLITVMTKGSDVRRQTETLANISKIVYDGMNHPL